MRQRQLQTVPQGQLQTIAQVDMLVGQWHDFLNSEHPPTTQSAYIVGLQLFRDWLLLQELDLNNAGTQDVIAWREELKKGYSTQTVNLRLSAVRAFYKWVIEQGAPIVNPANVRGAKRKNSKRHKREELTSSEVLALLESSSSHVLADVRDKALFSLMAFCAMRGVEIRRANAGDVRTKDGRQVIWYQSKGSTDKDDFKVVPAPAEKALRAWLRKGHGRKPKRDKPLFYALTQNKGERLSARGLSGIWQRRKELAGITGTFKTLHSLRHSAISNAARHSASSVQLKALGGWASIATADSYLHEVNRTSEPAEDLINYTNGD